MTNLTGLRPWLVFKNRESSVISKTETQLKLLINGDGLQIV